MWTKNQLLSNFIKEVITKETVQNFSQLEVVEIKEVCYSNGDEAIEESAGNFLMLHGTSEENLRGIIKAGFRNNPGSLGNKVYFTSSPRIAHMYSKMKTESSQSFIVVTEIVMKDIDLTMKKPVENVSSLRYSFGRFLNSRKAVDNFSYVVDMVGRKLVKENLQNYQMHDTYACEANICIPRFVVTCKEN